MKETVDPEDRLARLTQEATNQSTPSKALGEQNRRVPRRKAAAKRSKAPNSE